MKIASSERLEGGKKGRNRQGLNPFLKSTSNSDRLCGGGVRNDDEKPVKSWVRRNTGVQQIVGIKEERRPGKNEPTLRSKMQASFARNTRNEKSAI